MLKRYRVPVILFIVLSLILSFSFIVKQSKSFMQFIEGDKIARIRQEVAIRLGYRLEKDSIIKDFYKYSDDFIIVAAYIKSYDKASEETIFIEKQNNTYVAKISSSKGQKEVQIVDNEVNNSIDQILNRLHYLYIDEDGGNGIYFTLSDTGIGFGHGIAFSRDSKKLDGWGIKLTTTEFIKDDWYYFEAK